MSKLVTQAEFARMCGVNRSTVNQWVRRGRIKKDAGGLIDQNLAMGMKESTESKRPHHQARKAQFEQIRGLTKEEIDEFYRRIREQKESAKELKRLASQALRESRRAESQAKAAEKKREQRKTEKEMTAAREYQNRIARELTDTYLVKILTRRYASPELIDLKRQQLVVARALRQLKSTLKEKSNEQNQL
jgi:hypothetical protein